MLETQFCKNVHLKHFRRFAVQLTDFVILKRLHNFDLMIWSVC